jgi:3'-phosphoadenosine 5'-phosphosulfate (PAPS) 3'-phosphatase
MIVFRDFPVYRGKIDFIIKDANQQIGLVIIAGKSHKSEEYNRRKLLAYRSHLNMMSERLFKTKRTKIRLLLVHPVDGTKEFF